MDSNLYFIPILAEAIQSSDPPGQLKAAFEGIEALGQFPQRQLGLAVCRT